VSAASYKTITLLIDGIEAVYCRIETAIRRGHDVVVYKNDSGDRIAITWRTEQ
jgi:hypothetical protein